MEYIDPTTGKPYEFSLDTVTPYTAPETFTPAEAPVMTSEYTSTATPEVAPYKAPSYTPSTESTVAGQMEGLLSSSSPYMEAARASGIETANTRGLLNTSMAGEASQKAAIESALPIAQQDATTFGEAGLTGYQGLIQSGLSTQEYGQEAAKTNVQAGASAKLSAQEATQTAIQTAYNAAVTAGISAQEATQTAGLEGYRAALTAGLSEQDAVEALIQAGYDSELASQISAQEAAQAQSLEAIVQEGANLRQQVELAANETIAAMELTSQEQRSLADSVTSLGDEFMVQLTSVQSNPDLTDEAKTGIIATLQDSYKTTIDTTASVYGAEVDWSAFDETFVAEETPTTGTDTYTDPNTGQEYPLDENGHIAFVTPTVSA